MTLAEYLRRNKLTDAEFGAKCKPPITRSQIWTYRKRHRSPRAEHVSAIEAASREQVRAKDLIRNGRG